MVPVASAMASMAPIIAVAAVMTGAGGIIWIAVTVITVAGAPLSSVGIGAGGKGDNQHCGQGELQEPHGAFLPDRVLGGAGRDMSATPMSSKFGIVMATISQTRVRPGLARRLPNDPIQTIPFLDGRGSPIYPSTDGHADDNQRYCGNDEPRSGWNFLY